jgi:diguanylate cyclase (GGDEF)-like protein
MTQPAAAEPVRAVLRRQLKPLATFCAATVVVLAIGVTVAARTLMGSYQQLENSAASQKAEQVYRAFEADLRQLQISNRDYAEWDDAETFIHERDPEFIEHNFSAVTLLGLHADVLWIVDADGSDIYSSLADRATTTAATPAPADVLEPLRRFATRDRTLRARSPAERIVHTPRGLAAVSATEIARSDASNATGAVMLFGRFIADDEIARVEDTSRLPATMTLLSRTTPTGLPKRVADWAQTGSSGAMTFVDAVDEDTIVGYALVRDLDGTPLAVFATPQPRDIRALGSHTTVYLLTSVVLLFVAFGVTAVALVLRLATLQQRELDNQRRAEEQQRANRRSLATQAQRDSLTGLPNRLYVLERLPRLLRKMTDSHRLLALLCVDLDFFKNINDSRGHACGDHALKIVAKRLRAAVSTPDLVARMGGDEFVIVASLMPDADAIDRFASHVLAAIAQEVVIDGQPVAVTASVGVAVYPNDGADSDSLLKHADIALSQAKESGRRCYRFYAPDMDARVTEQATLQQALRKAIGTPQIYLDYQPIVDMNDGRVVSLEALARWRHPELGAIPPMQFIPAAEKSGLIVEMGEQALREVLAQQRKWLELDVPVVPIAVNVSALQVERVDFAALVKRLTAAAQIEPQWVRFEITESAMMKEPEKLIGTLRALRALGSQVLIDDFGTGFSSLSYLDKLPIDILKIDRAFVRDLDRGSESPVIRAIIDMARRLKLKTVAEGVETAAQAALLCDWGVDYAQGYFYSKPVAAHHCRALLEHLKRERPLTDTMVLRVIGS